jgi:ABC-2 type transport system ATP-binding protein
MLEVNNLNKSYEKFTLKNINLALNKGEIMGFIGPNGAGKSTTIKSIVNIIPFDSGKIIIDGMDSRANEIEVKQILGYVGEHLDFYEKVKLRKIYRFASRFYKNWDENLFAALIKRFDLDLDKKMKQLSKGMVVKFSLALALAHHPKLLILDEPTSGLDPVVRNDLLDILQETVRNEQCSVLFSSHITEDIAKIADRVAFIYDGEIKLVEDKKTILESYYWSQSLGELKAVSTGRLVLKNRDGIVIDISDCTDSEVKTLKESNKLKSITLDELLLAILKSSDNNYRGGLYA